MTQDEIIEMAVWNGFYKNDKGTITSPFMEDVDISELLLDFAKDVAAKEREACAKVCDDTHFTVDSGKHFAARIRARGEA